MKIKREINENKELNECGLKLYIRPGAPPAGFLVGAEASNRGIGRGQNPAGGAPWRTQHIKY